MYAVMKPALVQVSSSMSVSLSSLPIKSGMRMKLVYYAASSTATSSTLHVSDLLSDKSADLCQGELGPALKCGCKVQT